MDNDDKEYIIQYYYDNFIFYKNISLEKYKYVVKCFLYYEFTEWIYVYHKYGISNKERYEYYYNKCLEVDL